jgi:lipid-binding SYLF domain-containing protein
MKKIILVAIMILSVSLQAKPKEVIDAEVQVALKTLSATVMGSDNFIEKNAKGVLVIPNIVKAGIGVGGEYGEGALLEGNTTINYYSSVSASVGFQLGVEKKTMIYVFLTEKALNDFKNSDGWKGGVGAGITLATFGATEDISNININKPILLFAIGKKGLMYNLTLEGTKLTKIVR